MSFDPNAYGPEVARILAFDGDGNRLMPLVTTASASKAAGSALRDVSPHDLFPDSFAPAAALSGLWLYFEGFEQSHFLSQELHSPEGSFWHGILHRREPDAGNAAYWFRRTGEHPIFRELQEHARALIAAEAEPVQFAVGARWDPFAFIEFCESARRRPGSADEKTAREIQRREWQLLFDFCARPR